MLNLLSKDLILTTKFNVFILLYLAVISFWGATTPMLSSLIYIIMIVLTVYIFSLYSNGYEDKNNSYIMLNSLPLNRAQIVLSKYFSLLIYTLVGCSLLIILTRIYPLLGFNLKGRPANLTDCTVAFIIICIGFSFYYPVYFKFGGDKLRFFNTSVYLTLILLPTLIKKVISFDKFMSFTKWISTFNLDVIKIIFLLISISLLILSSFVSVVVFGRRDL
ncbi:hypothetical protein SH2C18_37850 [Clostridium sediminicola]|uniref:ABC-2 transporter permease n=1 Tax=Clostridium sediminicola TaxID=3114879 RepID=UPI0031F26127